MKKILLIVAFVCNYSVWSQTPQATLVSSGEIIAAGSKLHDEEKYDEALAQYKKVSRSDTNYAWALSEMALTYTVQKKYKEAILVAQKGLSLHSASQLDLLLRLANAYDEDKQYEQAKRIYEEGIQQFPHAHQLYFERGISLLHQKQTAAAILSFQQAIERNYFHPSSHRALGMVCIASEYKAQGLLSLMTYLLLNPNSQTATGTLAYAEEQLTREIDVPDSLKNLGITDALSEANRILKSKIALDSRYERKSSLNYKVVKQMQALLEKLAATASADDFWSKYYVPFYKGIWTNGYFEPFTYYTLASVDEKAHKRYEKPDKDMQKFRDWATTQVNQIRSYRIGTLNGVKKVYYHSYHENGRLRLICEKYNETTNKLSGTCESYHSTGYLANRGVYDDNGERIGEWKYYDEQGRLSHIETYQKDQLTYQSYYSNGARKQTASLQDGKVVGSLVTYSPSDIKIREITLKDGKRNGPYKEFYPDGTLQEEGTYIDNLKDGMVKEYHPHKVLAREQQYKNGKEDGLFRRYYRSGKLKVEGNTANDLVVGPWKWYYPNGQLQKEGTFVEGKEQGVWKEYHDNGVLERESVYEKGKLSGTFRSFADDGKLYAEHIYDKDKLKSIRYYDKQGKMVGESIAKGNTIPNMVAYYASGARMSEGKMVDGKAEGLWKFYHRAGWLMREATYKNDEKRKNALRKAVVN